MNVINTTNSTNFMDWYAIYVRSRHEFQISERLTKAGIDTFLPVVERLSRWKDRKRLMNFPLFPGYLFVRTDRSPQSRLSVLKTRGIVRFLGNVPGEPEPVPEEQIISLQTLIENKAFLEPYPYLKEGQRVRIKRGPLSGVEGIFVEKYGQHMLVISVDILLKGASLKIDAVEVETV